jgi:hypothetical protein
VKELIAATKKTLVERVDDIAEGVDLVLSAVTDSEVLEEIPLVSVGVKLLNARDAWVKHRYIRNCMALLQACKAADRGRRDKLWTKLSEDPDKIQDFVDTLFLIAADSSKPMKAAIVGHLVAALCNEQITYKDYDALVHMVHDASITALATLPEYFERSEGRATFRNMSFPEEPLLQSLGVAQRSGFMFHISELGQLLYRFGFGGVIVPYAP